MERIGQIALDPRLTTVARMVGHVAYCADVGCDHGRLGAWLIQTGMCQRVQMADISEASLQKARDLIGRLGLEEQVDFVVCDGVSGLKPPLETVVIAGMGGKTIADIVHRGRNMLGKARLVLAPNVAAAHLRRSLSEDGYRIVDECLVKDEGRWYAVISACSGESDYSVEQIEVGPVLLSRMPPELAGYGRFRLRVAQKAFYGAEQSGDETRLGPLRREIRIWEGVLKCLQQ
ncbi:MAG: SAM-dependent methyltransferase [Clostridia bacterium]|nr:SAM-dependent methyltransferase [Clostridia bacterium]